MGMTPMVIAKLCYVWTACDLALRREYALALTFVCYALANVGLMLVAYKQ
jgi:hypothetical protein